LSSNVDDDNNDSIFPFLNPDEIDSPYNQSVFNSSYVDHLSVCSSPLNDKINILSFNVQSLSAKFSDLKDFLDHCCAKSFLPEIILLQEIWQVTDPNIFLLKNYQPLIFKCRTDTRGGGVGIYVKNGINFSINNNSVFMDGVLESILIDVTFNKKKYVIGSMYRCIGKHPSLTAKDQFTIFNDLLTNLLDKISSSELVIGDQLGCIKAKNLQKFGNLY
jgi:exonuclease III